MAPPKRRDDNWIDGLRGIASFIVVTGHICTAFATYLHSPSSSKDGWPLFFQLPILRLCVGGRAAVCIFFLVTGFVNSINPITNAQSGNTEVALTNLAKATFTRSGRLFFPTNIAATVAWTVCQLGGFNMATRADSPWIRMVSKTPGPTFWEAIKNLVQNLTLFWSNGSGTYDPVHWTIVFFLTGSFRIYLTLLATTLVKTKWRVAIVIALYIFSWCSGDYIVGINIYSGMLIAQLQVYYGSRANSMLPKAVPAIMILIGLLISSYPQDNHDWMAWSDSMRRIMLHLTPGNTTNFLGRYWVNLGCTTLMAGIFFSRNARRVLTHPVFNFFGRCSFPVYLLHNTLIRTLLCWMVYGASAWSEDWSKVKKDDGNPIELLRAGTGTFVIAIPLFYVTLYAVAHFWMGWVDPLCARIVNWMREKMFREEVELGRGTRGAVVNTIGSKEREKGIEMSISLLSKGNDNGGEGSKNSRPA
ncbi:uncharacterized protein PADG_01403 [Paracoccidioides brasiliensis Pb18]|uniref:Acyltransferase 3 domain-containing protein n=1 Tax=Paracoccidioides brasiliensis (strain Pb18) TaxID=502780 RepID=C1G387_PARBD|nr:uncharacterized protein PADG_01403 [Paracoccidioides brasiliensis Pb18]EEH45253.1 hypothetical protein PADG_01403 [Paracoccidioides brasiliensis Pb18]